MLKHERAKHENAEEPRRQEMDPGLSKLAFLVSPVPFRRKKNSTPKKQTEKAKCKTSVFEALDSALKDICDQIKAEKRRGSLPDNSILHRLISELLPDIPERNSSLKALKRSPMHQPFHPLPQDGAIHCPLYPSECGRMPHSASFQDMDTNNNYHHQDHESTLSLQGGWTFLSFSLWFRYPPSSSFIFHSYISSFLGCETTWHHCVLQSKCLLCKHVLLNSSRSPMWYLDWMCGLKWSSIHKNLLIQNHWGKPFCSLMLGLKQLLVTLKQEIKYFIILKRFQDRNHNWISVSLRNW